MLHSPLSAFAIWGLPVRTNVPEEHLWHRFTCCGAARALSQQFTVRWILHNNPCPITSVACINGLFNFGSGHERLNLGPPNRPNRRHPQGYTAEIH